MPFIDISVPLLPELPAFPGDPPMRIEAVDPGADPYHLTRIQLGSHAGTHLDAPSHLRKNAATVDAIPLDTLIGPCRVVDLPGRDRAIGVDELRRQDLAGVRRLLLRTGNSALWQRPAFTESYRGLAPEAAAYLVELGIRLVGIDYLSVESSDGTGAVHRILLDANVAVLEGLDLSPAAAGDYELLCLPLRLSGLDGAPCRAVLRPLRR